MFDEDPRFGHLATRSRRVISSANINWTDEEKVRLVDILDRKEDPLLDTDFMRSLSNTTFDLVNELSATLIDRPEDRIRDPFEALKAVQEGILENEFEIPVTGPGVGFGARAAASIGVTPEEKVQVLRQRNLDAVALPSGVVLIKNPDGSISSLEQPGLEFGDVADAIGPGIEAVPAVAGAIAGAPSIGGTALGGAMGAAIGSEARSLVGNLLGASIDPVERLGRTVEAATVDAALTVGMAGAGGLLKMVGSRPIFTKALQAPFKDVVDLESMAVRPLFKAHGGDLPVSSLSKSPLVGIVRGGSSRTFGGTEVIGEEDRAAQEALNRIVDHYTNQVAFKGALKNADIGAFGQDGFALERRGFQAEAENRFNSLGGKIGDNVVFPKKGIAYLQKILKGHGLVDIDGNVLKRTSPMQAKGFKDLINEFNHLKSQRFSYNDLKVERTNVRSKAKTKGPTKGITKGLNAALTEDLLENATRIGGLQGDAALVKEVADLNSWYARKKFLFDDSDISKAFKDTENPSQLVQKLFSGNNVDKIKRAKEVLHPFHFNFIARQWLDRVVKKATKQTAFGEEFQPLVFAEELKRAGDDVIGEAFGPNAEHIFTIRDAGLALARGKERQVDPLLTGQNLRDMIGLITHPIKGSLQLLKGRKTAEFLTSEQGKEILTTGGANPVLRTLSGALKPTGAALRGGGGAMQTLSPGAPTLPFINELLSQRGIGQQSTPSDTTGR